MRQGIMKTETQHFPVLIEQDRDGVYLVECPVFQGCRSYGATIAEALENIKEAIAVCSDEETVEERPTLE